MSDPHQPISEAELVATVDKLLAGRRSNAAASRWTEVEMLRLAASGVAKVDLLGPRGTTLCSMDEIAAMAAVIALSGLIPPPHRRVLPERYQSGET